MGGTIIAVLSIAYAALLGYVVLLARKGVDVQQEAKPKRKRHEPEYITREELDEAIEEATKQLTYEWNEWYEKFDKLHLRLAKRAKRAEQQPGGEAGEQLPLDGERPSVLTFRRIGSV